MKLAIAFGSRGKGGALAHYEPGRKVINLTKLKGAGCLAHEFGHAFDHYLFGLCGYTGGLVGVNEPFLSYVAKPSEYDRVEHKAPEITNAMAQVTKAMRYKNACTRTMFYQSALALDKSRKRPYYSSIIEMFARCFESYIEDKLHEYGMQSQYLVHSTRNNSIYGDLAPYPTGEERMAINQAIENLINIVREHTDDEGYLYGEQYFMKDEYTSYRDNIVLIDKKTNKEIANSDDIPLFNTVKDYEKKLIKMNNSMSINSIDSGNTAMDKMNYWTDQAQKKGLLGRIGFAKLTGDKDGVSGELKIYPDKICINSNTDSKKQLEAVIEGTMLSVAKNYAKDTKGIRLLAKTMAIIVLLKEGYDVSNYLKDPEYKKLIQDNTKVREHSKMAYNLVRTLIK